MKKLLVIITLSFIAYSQLSQAYDAGVNQVKQAAEIRHNQLSNI